MVTDQDILNYLEGRTSPSEVQDINLWIDLNQANRSYFETYKSIWLASSNIRDYKKVDVDAEWAKFNMTIASEQNLSNQDPLLSKTKQRKFNLLPYSIAASLAILIGALFFLKSDNREPNVVEVMQEQSEMLRIDARSEAKSITLSDGTFIALKPNAIIEYSTSFSIEDTREVSLIKGLAEFDVAHDANKKFIVTCDGVGIEVLGTVFKVNADNNQVDVSLISGSVKAYEIANLGNNIVMEPGDNISFAENKFIKEVTEVIPIAPVQNSVVVKPVKKIKGSLYKLGDVLTFLDKKYGKKLKIDRKLGVDKSEQIRIDINQADLNTILQDLEKVTTLTTRAGKCDDCLIITSKDKK